MSLLILQELVVVLAAAILILFVSHKLKLPSIVGFLLTGILIGPAGLRLVKDTGTIDVLAGIGVVMLLFFIGLEYSVARLKPIQKYFWLGGGLQVAMTTAVAAAALLLSGNSPQAGVFYGFLVSLSSTAVVLKIMADRGETDSCHGRLSLGILIFQDLAMVPMIALVPVLASVAGVSLTALAGRFSLSLLAIAAVFLAAKFLMPSLLKAMVRTRVREIFLITALFLCLGMALLTSSLGLSLALGAFLAGVILAESEYLHQVVAEILPFKDLFNSLFFISIGMLLDLRAAWRGRGLVAVLVLAILFGKSLVVFVTARILRQKPRVAFLSAAGLAQVGEFSFVLAGVGRVNGLMPEPVFQAFIAASVLTILAAPFLVRAAHRLAERTEGILGPRSALSGESEKGPAALVNHVVIAGFGLNGRNLARVLKAAGISYIVLELNPDTVRQARTEGEAVIFGDVSSREILRAADIDRAKAVVFAISDPGATRRGVRVARDSGKDLFILVRTRYASEIEELSRLGADAVIPEEFETSIEIFTRVLEKYHIPLNIINAQAKVIRSECYGLLRGASPARPSMEKIAEILSAGTAETFFVGGGTRADGKTPRELDLRKETGATIIAVVRGEESFTSPAADFRIREGDTLVLVASHMDMDRAFEFLGSGMEKP